MGNLTRPSQRGESGAALLMVLIVAVILCVIGASTARLVIQSKQTQARSGVQAALANVNANIRYLVLSGTAWTNTVNHNASMGCLLANSACTAGQSFNFALYDAVGSVFIQDTTASPVGLTATGASCPSFGTGNCVLQIALLWTAICPGGAPSCTSPQVQVTGTLKISNSASAADVQNLNPANYSVNVLRGIGNQTQTSIISYIWNMWGEGSCNPGGWVARKFNTVQDPGQNVASPTTGTTATSFTLNPGTYSCHVVAPGYQLGTTKILLTDNANRFFYSAGANASPQNPNGVQLSLDAGFSLVAPTSFQVLQTCSFSSGTNPSELGLATPDPDGSTGNVTYTVVICDRTS